MVKQLIINAHGYSLSKNFLQNYIKGNLCPTCPKSFVKPHYH